MKKLICFIVTALLLFSSLSLPYSVVNAETTGEETITWQKYTHYLLDQAYSGTYLNGALSNDHIIIDGNKMTFYGYGKPQYVDYLFMAYDKSNKKTFSFNLSENGINYHSMYGGGYLFNGKIENNILTSYMILYEEGGIGLYKVGPVNVTSLNNGTHTMSRIASFTKVGKDHNIIIEVNSNTLNLWDNGVQRITDYQLKEVIGNGFGPIAVYKSHDCSILSYFTFSDFKMEIEGEVVVIIPIPEFTNVEANIPYQIDLSWSDIDEATSYDLEIDDKVVNVGKVTDYSHLNLLPGTTHKYRVRAITPLGIGEWSEEEYATVYKNPNAWTKMSDMFIPKTSAASVNVNNKIYVLGGITKGNIATKSIEIYDPLTNSWTKSNDMTGERHGMAAASIGEKIYVFGGKTGTNVLATSEVYDTKTGTWTTLPNMPTPRFNTAAISVNGKIYVIGGYNGNKYIDAVEEYDPATNQWTVKQKMPTKRSIHELAAIDNTIYVIGGYNGNYLNIVEAYNISEDLWVQKQSMNTARRSLGVEVVGGMIYAVGGINQSGELKKLEVYDPTTDTWTDKLDMPTPRGYLTFTSAYDLIFSIGGTLQGIPSSAVEMYETPF
ncbi:hypothetical protein EHE19_013600 [Ruminiclostridium herbifermentans]|uniref:Fibronectin type-III domain-containing protein n=1 Tax=Ruminiclostridium herbifermentans TaxID=2488810 RepID=A0A7H1VKK5_9FIRM|nr:kelch repeat-containing protein [Ruminiclostridium herbifermentans]QNU65917.1 hypothetical protein EHE19_013600 [Ruminiclostridium herbifermentans]